MKKPRETVASNADNRPIKLRILDKEVQISCNAGEEEDLAKAAAHIDKSMRELRQRNATSSIEKIAIVAAINTANALLKSRSNQARQATIADKVVSLNAKLDELLANEQDSTT